MAEKYPFYGIGQDRPYQFLPSEKADEMRKANTEKQAAEAEIARCFADSQMPEDIRSRAKAWGMESWATVLWSNAFLAGYRAAMRVRGEGGDNGP